MVSIFSVCTRALILISYIYLPPIHRQDQLRGKNEVGYQHECRADPSAGPVGAHEGQPDTSVDPDTSSIPSRLVLLLSYL